MSEENEILTPKIGLLGELEVELELVRRGWHPVRLDTAQMAANADLIALKGSKRITIQVKTTNAEKSKSHSNALGFGYSTGYIRDGKSIFNSKESPIVADVVIAVSYKHRQSKFVILPVSVAEALCRLHVDYWSNIPAKKRHDAGKLGKRSDSFPIFLRFGGIPTEVHFAHQKMIMQNLRHFEDAWHILDEPVKKLAAAKPYKLR